MPRLPLVSLALTAALVACNGDGNADPNPDVRPELARFTSCADYRSDVADSWLESLIQWRYGYGLMYAEDGATEDADASSGPADYSTTNVQEAGVDEPDMVKTDGKFLYVIDQQWDGALHIVKSWPPEDTDTVSTLELGGQPYSMFLDGDRLAIFSYVWDYVEDGVPSGGGEMLRGGYGTRVTYVDVTDRSAPVIEREIDVEGYMASARLIDHDAWVVFNHWMNMPAEVQNLAWDESLGLPEPKWDATDAEQEAIRAAAREILRPKVEAAVDALTDFDLLPAMYDHAEGDIVEGESLVTCTDVYHQDGTPQPGMLSVMHLDLSSADAAPASTAVFANGWTVYASQDNLYVAQTSWWWWWGWSTESDPMTTNIHKFSLEGDEAAYTASGSVDGWLWNQYALSEFEGNLRVASTHFDWWWGTSAAEDEGSQVTVLDENLDELGEVSGIAPGEQIMSTRFMGEEGYLVTFRQVDPLFSLDLSDPTNPQITGELKIPGFSSYMHPIDADHLVTVGLDGEADGTLTGLSIAVFDVSDPTAPSEVDRLTVTSDSWSWSEAMWDPHAFTFHNGVVTIPLYTESYDAATSSWSNFSGLWVVAATADGLTDLGRVNHDDLVAESECLYARWGYGCGEGAYWFSQVRRGVIMEDNLYSISDYGVKVNVLTTPDEEIASTLFHPR
jgi:uncharacterized secreted protein with C-terminal beta-propeller domain